MKSRKILPLLIASTLASTAFSASASLTPHRLNQVTTAWAQARVIATQGCKSYKTPGMNQAAKNLQIFLDKNASQQTMEIKGWKRINFKDQESVMSTINWNKEKCANWDKDYVKLANKYAAMGYGQKIKVSKPKINYHTRLNDESYAVGFGGEYSRYCLDRQGLNKYGHTATEERLGVNINFNKRDQGYYNAQDLYSKMGKEAFCSEYKDTIQKAGL